MSVEMKLGMWESRDGRVWCVDQHYPKSTWPWMTSNGVMWRVDGSYGRKGFRSPMNLVRYLGPIDFSPTPACAEAGPAGDPQTVSTEDPQESLKRMKRLEATIHRELEIYLPLVARLKTTASDLESAIKMLEREVEG